MSQITRRQVRMGSAAWAAAPAFVLPRAARAAGFTWKFGIDVPATHPVNVRAMAAAERILKETGNQIAINLFPNNQLGNDLCQVSAVFQSNRQSVEACQRTNCAALEWAIGALERAAGCGGCRSEESARVCGQTRRLGRILFV